MNEGAPQQSAVSLRPSLIVDDIGRVERVLVVKRHERHGREKEETGAIDRQKADSVNKIQIKINADVVDGMVQDNEGEGLFEFVRAAQFLENVGEALQYPKVEDRNGREKNQRVAKPSIKTGNIFGGGDGFVEAVMLFVFDVSGRFVVGVVVQEPIRARQCQNAGHVPERPVEWAGGTVRVVHAVVKHHKSAPQHEHLR